MDEAPPKSHARLWLAVVLLSLYTAFVLVVTLSPIPVDRGYQGAITRALEVAHSHGVPGWFGYFALEFSANVGMFVPLGFLIALALPRRWCWAALLIVPALSTVVELTQGAFLPQRVEDITDVIANTLGGCLGALAAIGLRVIVGMRDRTLITRAIWEHEQGLGRVPTA